MLNLQKNYSNAAQQEINRINAEEILGNALEIQGRDNSYHRGLV